MKVISLWQPWAMLMVIGAKKYETRHWRLPSSMVGQWCLIHAAKKYNHEIINLCVAPYFREAFIKANIWGSQDLPFGAIVGMVKWGKSFRIDAIDVERRLEDSERAFGDFTPGRWAWPAVEAKRLKIPIPCTGRQGFFNYDGQLGEFTDAI
jgi:hypothetical protein